MQYKCYEGDSTLTIDFLTSNYCITDEMHRKHLYLYCGLAVVVCDGAWPVPVFAASCRSLGAWSAGRGLGILRTDLRWPPARAPYHARSALTSPHSLTTWLRSDRRRTRSDDVMRTAVIVVVKGMGEGGGTHTVIILQLQN